MDSPEAAGEGSHDDFMEKDAGTCPFLILTTFKKCRALKWVIWSMIWEWLCRRSSDSICFTVPFAFVCWQINFLVQMAVPTNLKTIKFPKRYSVNIICNLGSVGLNVVTQRTLVPWSPWNLLHQALIWLAFALLPLVLRLVMNVLSWCLEAILLPLPCFSLQRQGSYQWNEQTLESKHVFSIFFHGYGSLQYTVGWDV